MPINFNKDPYYDDFLAENNYLKILFRPGRAVQARELTQMQSILQNQISAIGSHMFKDGSRVAGGELNYSGENSNVRALQVAATDIHGNSNFIKQVRPGMQIRRATDNPTHPQVVAVVRNVKQKTSSDGNDVIFIRYIRGETPGIQASEVIVLYNPDIGNSAKYTFTTISSKPETTASELTISSGLYYYKGKFLKAGQDTVILQDQNSGSGVNFKIGYEVLESIVTSDDNSSLLEPVNSASNYGAPGADRYQTQLKLRKIPIPSPDQPEGASATHPSSIVDNFFQIAKVVEGRLVWTSQHTVYNKIADMLAKRTYEESGNYIANPYNLTFEQKTVDGPTFSGKLSGGVSYVKGYRHEVKGTQVLDIDKARDAIRNPQTLDNMYGDNFVYIYDSEGVRGESVAARAVSSHNWAWGIFPVGSAATANARIGSTVDIHCIPNYYVTSPSQLSYWEMSKIGTARPIMMTYDGVATAETNRQGLLGSVYRLYLTNFKSSSISGTTDAANKIECTSASSDGSTTTYTFPSSTHGILATERISVFAENDSRYSVSNFPVKASGATTITIDSSLNTATLANGNITLTRTTGNVSAEHTAVLDGATTSHKNNAYNGATITFNPDDDTQRESRKIVGHCGSISTSEAVWSPQTKIERDLYPTDQLYLSGLPDGLIRAGTVIFNRPLNNPVSANTPYRIDFGMHMARSIVENANVVASTGKSQYPAEAGIRWNIDTVNGIVPSAGVDQSVHGQVFHRNETNGGRIDGDCVFNQNGSDETLLFPMDTGNILQRVAGHGDLSTGLTSNSTLYYAQYMQATCGGTNHDLTFTVPTSDFFGAGSPKVYPYNVTTATSLGLTSEQIRDNLIFCNRSAANVVPYTAIDGVTITVSGERTATVVVSPVTSTAGDQYELLIPMKAENVKSAYKQLVLANTTDYSAGSSGENDLDNGQVFVASASLANISSLTVPDGFRLHRVIDSFNPASPAADIISDAKNVTNCYEFHTGQKDTFYDLSYIKLKADRYRNPTGNLLIMFDYFKRVDAPKSSGTRNEVHSSHASFFSIDSYQYNTELVFSSVSGSFSPGDYITSNSNARGYIAEFANTSGYTAKAILANTTGSFLAGETVVYKSVSGDKSAVVHSVVTPDLLYSEIPTYSSKSGRNYNLKNVIDCRPYANTTLEHLSSAGISLIPTAADPEFGKTATVKEIKSEHVPRSYAPRIDKLVVDKNGDYFMVKGEPNLVNPVPPLSSRINGENELTLYNIHIPAYTSDLSQVVQNKNKSVRHTMKDISQLEKRVENLEYYTALNALEKNTNDMLILDSDGRNRFKNGIIVDNFSGFQVTDVLNSDCRDVGSQGNANTYTMRIGSGLLQPAYEDITEFDGTEWKFNSSSNLKTFGRITDKPTIAMLDYDEVPYDQQISATETMSVNPFDSQSYVGRLKIYPKTDHWFDTTSVQYGSNSDGSLDHLEVFQDLVNMDNGFSAILGGNDFWIDIQPQFINAGSIEGAFQEYIPWGINEHYAYASGGGNPNWFHGQQFGSAGTWLGDDTLNTGHRGQYSLDYLVGNPHDVSRSIFLKQNITGGRMMNPAALAEIEQQVMQAAGMSGHNSVNIFPYIRERDIIIDGSGLKPFHRADIRFDDTPVERYFMPATKIYLRNVNGDFSSDLGEGYETITLTGTGVTANAILLAVRDDMFSEDNLSVGYIVPVIDDATGKIDFGTYTDGFYDGWSTSQISASGFNGTGARSIKGNKSSATADLVTETQKEFVSGTPCLGHYNGHFSGQATGGSTTTMDLSYDAGRYVASNFRSAANPQTDTSKYTDLPVTGKVYIVAGSGQGQEMMVKSYDAASRRITFQKAATVAVDSSSIYSLCMSPTNISRNPELSQYGTAHTPTTRNGEKFGILHIPNKPDTAFTYGKKLIELTDRADGSNWLVENYAATYYDSQGYESTTLLTNDFIGRIQEQIAPADRFEVYSDEIGQGGLDYVPTYSSAGVATGKLAIAHSVTVANGGVSNTSLFDTGSSTFGSVAWLGEITLGGDS